MTPLIIMGASLYIFTLIMRDIAVTLHSNNMGLGTTLHSSNRSLCTILPLIIIGA
jgi:hypothetical protein